jgi:hypothetical protein
MPLFLRVLFLIAAIAGAAATATAQEGTSAAMLRKDYEGMAHQLSSNQFGQPLHLVSAQSTNRLSGNLYARVNYPMTTVAAELSQPASWCEVLILHINTKHCRASSNSAGAILAVRIGTKENQALDAASLIEFTYRIIASAPDYLEVELRAAAGPMTTTDYRIVLKAIAVETSQSFLHFSYSYSYGFAGRVAMQAYLTTIGRDKVGFTIIGKKPGGEPEYIANVRGLVERNTMRYFLAIDAYLASLAVPAATRLDFRLRRWFAATQAYARQLHEMDSVAYLDLKRKEYQRQQLN